MTTSTTTFSLSSRLRTLGSAEVNITPSGDDTQDKKHARKEISLQYTSPQTGFLHAALVKINKEYFLFAGPSGIGKTTYANHLNRLTNGGVTIIASDWVAIEQDDGVFYASDLNFEHELRHEQRCPLTGVIFLTLDDAHDRDAFYPNSYDFTSLLKETLDTASTQELAVLNMFWRHNRSKLPFVCAVQARRRSEEYIATTLYYLCTSHAFPTKQVEVGVIGMGALGSTLAFQLGQLDFVTKVHIYNRDVKKSIGYALDMNQAALGTPRHDLFVAHTTPEEVFEQSDAVFFCFRDETHMSSIPKDAPERWGKFYAHLPVVRHYAQIASKTRYTGAVFLLSNPVDILSYAFYHYSQAEDHALRTYQVWGVGLELDVARAFTSSNQQSEPLRYNDIRIYGSHADTFVLQTPLCDEHTAEIDSLVRDMSGVIRKHIPRTVYGPVGATIKTFTAYMQQKSVHVTTIRNNAFVGERIRFSNGRLPQIPTNADMQTSAGLVDENRRIIAQYLNMV